MCWGSFSSAVASCFLPFLGAITATNWQVNVLSTHQQLEQLLPAALGLLYEPLKSVATQMSLMACSFCQHLQPLSLTKDRHCLDGPVRVGKLTQPGLRTDVWLQLCLP